MTENVSKIYESIIILNTKLGEEGIPAAVEKFKSLIESNGTLEKVDEWGKRRLAYEINDETEGFYVMYTFATSDINFIPELERVYKITDGILRTLTVVKQL